MDAHTFQENWGTLCRKFPLVCVVDLSESTFEETKDSVKSLCVHFDHVAIVTKNLTQADLEDFCSNERIINLSCFRSSDIPGDTLEKKIVHTLKGQMILVQSKVNNVNSHVRWRIYDKVKEMKSPLTDVIKLNSSFQYCTDQHESFVIKLRLS